MAKVHRTDEQQQQQRRLQQKTMDAQREAAAEDRRMALCDGCWPRGQSSDGNGGDGGRRLRRTLRKQSPGA